MRTHCYALLALSIFSASLRAEDQVTQLQARHADGQTMLTWNEVEPAITQEDITVQDYRKVRQELDKARKIRYRVYRSDKKIASVDGLEPIAEVSPLTCWNIEYYGDAKPQQPALRYVVEEDKGPVAPGTGIYAHNPKEAGDAFYAVVVSVNGTANATLTDANATQAPTKESVGRGPFILQRTEKPKEFQYIKDATLHYYVRWESPPNCSVASRPFDYLVAIPPKLAKPAPVGLHLHCWGGNLNGGYAWWSDAEKGAILIATNQIPYDWWTGYHEFKFTGKPLNSKEDWLKGVVRPYSQTRLFSFLDWVATKWDVDLKRTFTAGTSMGGSGTLMLAIRYGKRIAYSRSWVGVHTPAKSPTFKGSYEGSYGKPEFGVKFEDGTPVWDYYDDVRYLKKYPEKEIGFLSFCNGKNDGGIGWPQAVEFFQALQETKRPHLFMWGQDGHGQRTVMPLNLSERVMPIDVATDLSLPAFTHCSLDNNPGNGDPNDGEPRGQANMYLFWETKDLVDEADKWEMTVGLVEKAPKPDCTVDLTPRRVQKFKVKPGEKMKWSNVSLADNKEIQTGEATADQHGLLTIEKLTVSKGKNRIKLSR